MRWQRQSGSEQCMAETMRVMSDAMAEADSFMSNVMAGAIASR